MNESCFLGNVLFGDGLFLFWKQDEAELVLQM